MQKNLKDLKKRLFISLPTIVVIGLLMVFSDHVLIKAVMVLFVALLTAIGVWEYVQLAKAKEIKPALKSMIFVAVSVVISFFMAHKLMIFYQMPAVVLSFGAVLFFLMHFKEPSSALFHVATEFFGVCYVAVPMSFMLAILYPMSESGVSWDGRVWLVYLILVTKVADVGAYFVGRLWGKTRLAPVLSPKKTVEGAVAGFVSAVLCSALFSYLASQLFPSFFALPLLGALFLGSCIGIVGQVGDLAESLLKRDADIKDSNTLPGLGGVLDMIDSLLLTTPVVYFYLQFQR